MVIRSLVLLFACFTCLPTTASAQPVTPAAGLVRMGDMLLFPEQLSRPPNDGLTRAADGFVLYYTGPWPGGVVPVAFDANVADHRRQLFMDGCAAWAPVGVRCVEWTDEFRRLDVTASGSGCAVTVGAPTHFNGRVEFGDGACWDVATIVHDLGHVFGLIHEHQRPDRDAYVEIHWENLQPNTARGYEVLVEGRSLGDYDFDSVMHFSRSANSINGEATMEPRPAYADRGPRMGQSRVPSRLDVEDLAQFYRATPRSPADPVPPMRITQWDIVVAYSELHKLYVRELQREGGLTIDGRPDFPAVAAWLVDIYLNSRTSGYTEGESLYNMRAGISQTDEWRLRNPRLTPQAPLPIHGGLRLDRGEYLQAMYRLDEAYRTELLRPAGLSIEGGPDFIGLSTWIFGLYLDAKLAGRSPDEAWAAVLAAIRASEEYRQKH
jgi:hypothetical protein